MQILLSLLAVLSLGHVQVPASTAQTSTIQASESVDLAGSSAAQTEYDGVFMAPAVDDGRGTPYIVEKSDNICGLDEPRQLTNPAVVDYDSLIEATDEYRKIQKDKIDPTSSEGITLMTKARARVLKACESVRASQGHCSVWKDIKRRDKRSVDDITDEVKRQL
ncbi:hypothetical protein [Planctomycetes bacterium Poly30]|uniref:hypothetical protein n=1 Tax=Saltatorellus ferox TaxID=2528018 RepID=UPI0011A36E06